MKVNVLMNGLLALFRRPSAIFFWVVFLPILVAIWTPDILRVVFKAFFYFLIFYPCVVLVKVLASSTEHNEPLLKSYMRHVLLLPAGVAYGSNLAKLKPPLVTVGLILVNILVFFSLSDETRLGLAFYPYGEPDTIQVIVAFFSSVFLHANIWHLLGNMFFLWAFGSIVVGRLGHGRYFILYILFGGVANLCNVLFLFVISWRAGGGVLAIIS